MSDNPTQTPQPPQTLPPLPEHFEIPTQLIEEWIQVPSNQYIEPSITRRDLDRLLFSFNKLSQAQAELHQGLIEWSHGRIAEANAVLHNSNRLNIEAQNEFRQFFMALVISSLRNMGRAGA